VSVQRKSASSERILSFHGPSRRRNGHQSTDVLYRVAGVGLSGAIILKFFYDSRPLMKELVDKLIRFVSKYGAPDKSGCTDDDLEPYRQGTKRGIFASLSDDEKSVVCSKQ